MIHEVLFSQHGPGAGGEGSGLPWRILICIMVKAKSLEERFFQAFSVCGGALESPTFLL
ncbi:hypothetical protein KAU04_07355 [bacterium]|nr:hypothetical protein [bacterium]